MQIEDLYNQSKTLRNIAVNYGKLLIFSNIVVYIYLIISILREFRVVSGCFKEDVKGRVPKTILFGLQMNPDVDLYCRFFMLII